MREILLTHSKVALVDDEDYEWLSRYRWSAWLNKHTQQWYARRTDRSVVDGVRKVSTFWMHREVLGLGFGDKLHGDHIDHDTLNNQRYNLRRATFSQNQGNSVKHKAKTSLYKGVSLCKRNGMYAANISVDRKQKFLGYSDTPEGAAQRYNEAALEIYGEFAALNEIPTGEAHAA